MLEWCIGVMLAVAEIVMFFVHLCERATSATFTVAITHCR
jgi:hypothetical protein